jgi:hypothetical protein
MRLYSYIVRYDIGFAPNPFHGRCTLATCKPRIRRTASVGDWIAGVGARQRLDGHLVFAMQVSEKMTFDEYWSDPRFQRKKPDVRGSLKYRYGDNIYHRNDAGDWEQANSRHSLDSGAPNPEHVATDTGADAVLVADRFTYWGCDAVAVPEALRDWDGVDLARPGRDHQWKPHNAEMIATFTAWIDSLPKGCRGEPADW